MLTVTVTKMKCGGCAAGVEKAVKGVDADATVSVDLATKQVTIDSVAGNGAVIEAIQAAGFDAVAA